MKVISPMVPIARFSSSVANSIFGYGKVPGRIIHAGQSIAAKASLGDSRLVASCGEPAAMPAASIAQLA